jgi:hypothetical protein
MADHDNEKHGTEISAGSPDHTARDVVDPKGVALNEAADLYGNMLEH